MDDLASTHPNLDEAKDAAGQPESHMHSIVVRMDLDENLVPTFTEVAHRFGADGEW